MTGCFITFEGIDGVGKSTQVEQLAAFIRSHNQTVLQIREPGGTPLGEKIRTLFLNHPMDAKSELLLLFAARRELLQEVVRPALAKNHWVLSDRFVDSSYAYQGGGRRLSFDDIAKLDAMVTEGLAPDLTFFIDTPLEVILARRDQSSTDRFESEHENFHRAVISAYRDRAKMYPERIKTVDGAASIENIQKQLRQHVQEKFFSISHKPGAPASTPNKP